MPGVNIKAPSLKPPRVSILSSAEVITLAGDRWWGGIRFKKLSGNPAEADGSELEEDDVFILPICPPEAQEKITWPRGSDEQVEPFAVYATEECSTFGLTPAELQDRARQKLSVNEAWTVEHELWFGTATNNFSFVDAPISLGTGLDALSAFALLDAKIAANRTDGRGMIHLTPRTFDLLQQYTLFRREGNVWFSPNDNIVVPGRGYGYEGDAETDSVMYGHPGIIQIVRSEVIDIPENEEEIGRQAKRSINDFWVVAERVYAYMLANSIGTDGAVGVYSVGITLASTGGGGGGGDASAANQVTANNLLTDIETAVDGLEAVLATQDARLANLEDSLTADAAALSNVASQDTNINLLASAATRRGVIIHNDDTGILYIKYGSTASTTSYTVKVPADGYWEMPMPIYTGAIDGIWTTSGSGSARITELT